MSPKTKWEGLPAGYMSDLPAGTRVETRDQVFVKTEGGFRCWIKEEAFKRHMADLGAA